MTTFFQVDSLFGLGGLFQELIAVGGVYTPVCEKIFYLQSDKMSRRLITEVSRRSDLAISDVDVKLEGSTLIVIDAARARNIDESIFDERLYEQELRPLVDGLQPSSLSAEVYGYITLPGEGESWYLGQTCSLEGPRGRSPWKHPVEEVQTVAAVRANVGRDGRRLIANLVETLLFSRFDANKEDWKNKHCVVGASPLGGGSDYSDSQRKAGGSLLISFPSLFLSLCLT